MVSVIVPPNDCLQISLSLDRNLVAHMNSPNMQLYILNDLLTKCLGTLTFQLDKPSVSSKYMSNDDSDAPSRKRARPSDTGDNSNDMLAHVARSNQPSSRPGNVRETSNASVDSQFTLSEVKEEEEDDIICVKQEAIPAIHSSTFESSFVGNPYESSEIIPGLFSEVPDIKEEHSALFSQFNSNSDGLGFEEQFTSISSTDTFIVNSTDNMASKGASPAEEHRSSKGEGMSAAGSNNRIVTQLPLPKITQHLDQYFSCPLCDQQFAVASNAHRHVRSVHGNTRYACQFCHKTYNRKDHLKHHVKATHQLNSEVASAMLECPSTTNIHSTNS